MLYALVLFVGILIGGVLGAIGAVHGLAEENRRQKGDK